MLHERLDIDGFFSPMFSARSLDDDELERVVVDEIIRFRVRRRRRRLLVLFVDDDDGLVGSSSLEREILVSTTGVGALITVEGRRTGLDTFDETLMETTCLLMGLITSILVFNVEDPFFILGCFDKFS